MRRTEHQLSSDNRFMAEMRLSPTDSRLVEFTVDSGVENLTYDHVLESAYQLLEQDFPEKYYPEADVGGISAATPEGLPYDRPWCPVVSDDDTERIAALNGTEKCFLVLPAAQYYALNSDMEEAGEDGVLRQMWDSLVTDGIIGKAVGYDSSAMQRLADIAASAK